MKIKIKISSCASITQYLKKMFKNEIKYLQKVRNKKYKLINCDIYYSMININLKSCKDE